MRAEFEVAKADGQPVRFAFGCLLGAWRTLPQHIEGRFTLVGYALSLGLVLPMAATLTLAALSGFPFVEASDGVAGFPRSQAEGALAMIDTEEVREANRLHSASDLKALRIPVLAVFGARNPLVVASAEAAETRRVLANNAHGKVVVLDGLSHWFQEGSTTGGEEEVAKLGPNAGCPRLVTLVADWLAHARRYHGKQADESIR